MKENVESSIPFVLLSHHVCLKETDFRYRKQKSDAFNNKIERKYDKCGEKACTLKSAQAFFASIAASAYAAIVHPLSSYPTCPFSGV